MDVGSQGKLVVNENRQEKGKGRTIFIQDGVQLAQGKHF